MRILAIVLLAGLSLVAAPGLVADTASACDGREDCPAYVQECVWGGVSVWVLGKHWFDACLWGP